MLQWPGCVKRKLNVLFRYFLFFFTLIMVSDNVNSWKLRQLVFRYQAIPNTAVLLVLNPIMLLVLVWNSPFVQTLW